LILEEAVAIADGCCGDVAVTYGADVVVVCDDDFERDLSATKSEIAIAF
jgi:hypothetical protein